MASWETGLGPVARSRRFYISCAFYIKYANEASSSTDVDRTKTVHLLKLVHCHYTCIRLPALVYFRPVMIVLDLDSLDYTMLETRQRDEHGRLVRIDRTNNRYGQWTVIAHVQGKYWLCKCDCGSLKNVRGTHLDAGKSCSCGCIKSGLLSKAATTHGMSHTPTYQSWTHMLDRCRNPRHHAYSRYGGSGIVVCDEWLRFETFLNDMGERPSLQHSIDRFPNNQGNYSKSNCRWATKKEQSRNMTANRLIYWKGVARPLSEWAEVLGICRGVLGWRMDHWTIDRAFTTPVRPWPCGHSRTPSIEERNFWKHNTT